MMQIPFAYSAVRSQPYFASNKLKQLETLVSQLKAAIDGELTNLIINPRPGDQAYNDALKSIDKGTMKKSVQLLFPNELLYTLTQTWMQLPTTNTEMNNIVHYDLIGQR